MLEVALKSHNFNSYQGKNNLMKTLPTYVSLFLSATAVAIATNPQVTTSGGVVEGNALPGANEFLGMKFADAERYERPVDFTGKYPQQPLIAKDFQLACMQVGNSANETYGSEDCLFMNVWQPSDAKPGDKLPVLVFIYGGSNMFGEAEAYNGSAMPVRHNVVYASLAYRTGPIGWMAFEEDFTSGKTTGNYGQLDQQSALRWVQREIHNFGGDPDKVSIHGQSSGAACTALHLVMPESKNLLRGLISESGGLSANTNINGSIQHSHKIASDIGCSSSSSLKKCLQQTSPINLTKYTYKFGWGPVVDSVTIPDVPIKLVMEGKVNNISVIMGAQTNDTMRELMKLYTKHDGTIRPISSIEFRILAGEAAPRQFHERLFDLYTPTTTASVTNVQLLGSVTSDKSLCASRRTCNEINKQLGKVFMYRFNYFYQSNPQCTAEPNYHPSFLGAIHEDEVTFVMGQPIFMFQGSCCGKWGAKLQREPCPQLPQCTNCFNTSLGTGYHAYFNDKEWDFSQTVGGYWAQFARTGSPNMNDKITWPVFSTDEELTHNIVLDADLTGGSVIESTLYNNDQICKFWDDVSNNN